MSPRPTVSDTGAAGGSVLDLAGDYGYEVVALTDSSSSVIDPGDLNPSAAHDRKEREGVVDGADSEAVFDVGYDVLVEAIPMTFDDAEPGFSHVEWVLVDDRHVVLASKGPAAERYVDLRAFGVESGGMVRFEAAVGGATPTLSITSDPGAPHVTTARDVLNGMTDFILSWVAAEGLDYEHVFAETQDLDVAEADLTFDADGIDAALRFVILANVLSDGEAEYALDGATVEGTRNIPGTTLDLAVEDGRTTRFISEATADRVRVAPWLIPQDSVLSVTDMQNIVQLRTKHAGQLNIDGRGAGGPETATAILSDVSRLEQAYKGLVPLVFFSCRPRLKSLPHDRGMVPQIVVRRLDGL